METDKVEDKFTLRVMESWRLNQVQRAAIVAVCTRAYAEDASDLFEMFPHATHVLGMLGNRLVSHALWVTRLLQVDGSTTLNTAYVEAVATDPHFQRRGFASAVLRHLAREVDRLAFDLAALSPSDPAFYARLGWELWRGPLFIRTARGLERSPAEEQVMILRLTRTPPLDLTRALSAEWRRGELW